MANNKKYRNPENFTLVLCCDIDQNSETLQFSLRNQKGDPVKLVALGPTAGSYNFVKNDMLEFEVEIMVDPTSTPNKDIDIDIVNCTLVSIKPPNYSALSLFNKFNAVQSIAGWTRIEDQKRPSVFKFRASEKLTVMVSEGQWKISGYLSVKVAKDRAKIYFFDPESSAGGGLGTEQ